MRSGAGFMGRNGAQLEPRKELLNHFPNFIAAGEAPPMPANQARETVTFVDGSQVVVTRSLFAINKQCFDIRLHGVENRVAASDIHPAVRIQKSLGGSGGTRVK